MTAPHPMSGRRGVVIGGAGAVGAMFVEVLVGAGASVCVVDTVAAPERGNGSITFERRDVLAMDPPLETEIGRADIVVLAVPQAVALAAVERVADAMAPGALLVDTLSVKEPIVAAVRSCAPPLQLLSLNPMFAPSLGIDGGAIAAVVVHDGPRAQELLEVLRDCGGRIVELGAHQHDALAATTQALTHATVLAFGLALVELDVDVGELGAVAPPPHTTLLALLARIASAAPETYWDVQAANAQSASARAALATGLRRLADVVDAGGPDEFAALLEDLREVMGPELDAYGDVCRRLFEVTHRARTAETDRMPAPAGTNHRS